MNKENQWSEINKDVSDIAKKVKSKIDEEDLVANEIIDYADAFARKETTSKNSENTNAA